MDKKIEKQLKLVNLLLKMSSSLDLSDYQQGQMFAVQQVLLWLQDETFDDPIECFLNGRQLVLFNEFRK